MFLFEIAVLLTSAALIVSVNCAMMTPSCSEQRNLLFSSGALVSLINGTPLRQAVGEVDNDRRREQLTGGDEFNPACFTTPLLRLSPPPSFIRTGVNNNNNRDGMSSLAKMLPSGGDPSKLESDVEQIAKEMNGVLKVVSRKTLEKSSFLACVVCFYEPNDQTSAQNCIKKETLGRIHLVRKSCTAKKQDLFRRAMVAMLQTMDRGDNTGNLAAAVVKGRGGKSNRRIIIKQVPKADRVRNNLTPTTPVAPVGDKEQKQRDLWQPTSV